MTCHNAGGSSGIDTERNRHRQRDTIYRIPAKVSVNLNIKTKRKNYVCRMRTNDILFKISPVINIVILFFDPVFGRMTFVLFPCINQNYIAFV